MSLFAAGTWIAIAGLATSVYGSYQQGEAAEDAAEYQNKVAIRNAEIEENKRLASIDKSLQEKAARGKEHARDVATGRVSTAASGLLIDSGSVRDWEGDMSDAYISDIQMMDHNQELVANGFMSAADAARADGQNALVIGQNNKTASQIGGIGTALSGAGDLGMSWAKYKAE